jgi:DNA-binding LacI/PurR family transcriptional regulator
MGVYVHPSPVNPAQIAAVLGSSGATVRKNGDDYEVEVEEFTGEQIEAAVAGVEYEPDPPAQSIEDEFAAYKANVQAAMAMRDEVDAARDEWLIDLEMRLLAVEG